MKSIDIDDDLYTFIASQTKHIGESASDILRRLLMPESPLPVADKSAPAKAKATAASDGLAETQSPEVQQPVASAPVADGVQQNLIESITDRTLAAYSKRVDQFLFILSTLHQIDPAGFEKVTLIKGKNRIYFATSKEALLETGSSTNPKSIPDSPYWVVTNNNTGKKVAMLEQVLQVLGYDEGAVKTIVARFAPESQ